MSNIKYLYNSGGEWIAFKIGRYLYNSKANWIGWFPWDEENAVTKDGKYLGSIYPAMFVFATGGLDSLIKQAIKDVLAILIDLNAGANSMFESFVEREIQDKKSDENKIDSKLMAKLLTSNNPREELKIILAYNLTSNSLQSKDQILKIAAYFDVPSASIVKDFGELQNIFLERNKIIHEMDINFDGKGSKRNKRKVTEIVKYINVLLELGEKFIEEVDNRMNVA